MKQRPRTFKIEMRQIVNLILAGWDWCATGHSLRSPSGRRRWHVRTTGPGAFQLEPPFDPNLLQIPESNR